MAAPAFAMRTPPTLQHHLLLLFLLPLSTLLFFFFCIRIPTASSCSVDAKEDSSLPPFADFGFVFGPANQNDAENFGNGAKNFKNGAGLMSDFSRNSNENSDVASRERRSYEGAYSAENGAKSFKNGAKLSKDGAVTSENGAKETKDGAKETKDGAFDSTVIIGGIFDIHEETSSREFLCRGKVHPQNVQRLEAFLWAVDTIKTRCVCV